MSDFIDCLALVVSGIGIGVSVWAKRDSKRSADAAEISASTSIRSADAAEKSAVAADGSAKEAMKSRRIQQAELLAPHFQKISEAIRRIKSGEKFQPTTDTIFYAIESIGALRGLLPEDEQFQDVLSNIFDALTKEHPYGSDLHIASVGYSIKRLQSEHGQVFDDFETKRRELLNIG